MDAKPSTLKLICPPEGTARAVTSIVIDLVLRFLRGSAGTEQGVGVMLVQLVRLKCRAWSTIFLADLQIFRCIRYLRQKLHHELSKTTYNKHYLNRGLWAILSEMKLLQS